MLTPMLAPMTQVSAQKLSPQTAPSGTNEMSALCPRCRAVMVYVTALPHPHAPAMRRTVFLCSACNRPRKYSLSAAMAEAYAALFAPPAK